MSNYASYVICGTPRSGSTLLVEMLISSGVAGSPNSFFREQSIPNWADRWSIDRSDGLDERRFDAAYIPAMLAAGSNGTGIFGLRLMFGSAVEAIKRLQRLNGGPADLAAQFDTAFGPVLYVHLSRRDKVAQAVSLVRAEQSGLWHLAADGSVYEGTATPRLNVYDGQRLGQVFDELNDDDAAWEAFFANHDIEPVRLVYETMTADPQAGLAAVLAALGRDAEIAKTVTVGTRKMSGSDSAEWAAKFRAERGLQGRPYPA